MYCRVILIIAVELSGVMFSLTRIDEYFYNWNRHVNERELLWSRRVQYELQFGRIYVRSALFMCDALRGGGGEMVVFDGVELICFDASTDVSKLRKSYLISFPSTTFF